MRRGRWNSETSRRWENSGGRNLGGQGRKGKRKREKGNERGKDGGIDGG